MNIGIIPSKQKEVIDILNSLLADAFILYTKTRKAHWNVEGLEFRYLHKMFQDQYEDLDEAVDNLAERVRQLGGFPIASTGEFKEKSKIKESSSVVTCPVETVKELLSDHEEVIRSLRVAIPKCDLGTANMLTDIIQAEEKTAWMLRASAA